MAMTTGVINATNLKIYAGTKQIARAKSASVSLSMDPIDITSKDSAGWQEKIAGQKSWTMSGDSLVQFDTATGVYGVNDIQGVVASGTLVAVTFGTGTQGNYQFSGSGYFNSLEMSGGVEEAASFSFGITGTSALTWSATA